jgi:hypothetical protein
MMIEFRLFLWRIELVEVGEVAARGCCCGGLRWLKGKRSLLGWLVG